MECKYFIILILNIILCLPAIVTAGPITAGSYEEIKADSDLQEALSNNKLTLERAQVMALQHNAGLKKTRQNGAVALYRNLQLSKQYFPDINLKVGTYKSYGNIDDNEGTAADSHTDVFANYVELRVVLPWWHKKGLLKDAESAQMDETIADEQYLNQVKDLRLSIYKAYFSVVLQDKLLILAQNSLEVAEIRRNKMRERFALGTCSQLDIYSEEANVLANLAAVESAQSDRDDKYQSLLTLMNIPPITNFALSDTLQFTPYVKRDLNYERIVSANTSLQRLEIDKAEISLEKSKQSWFPKLSVYTGYRDEDRSGGGYDTRGEYYGAVIECPFPFFRGGVEATEAAKIQKVGAEKDLWQAEENIRHRIFNMEQQIFKLEKIIRLDEQLLLAKKREIEFQRSNFALGRISSVELNLVEATAASAEQHYFKYVYKHMTVVAELINLITPGYINL